MKKLEEKFSGKVFQKIKFHSADTLEKDKSNLIYD
jgi:hypothetical protein